MSERLVSQRTPRGTDGAKLRKWAFLFVTAGVVGRAILQNSLLGVNILSGEEMMALLNSNSAAMTILTAALVCQLAQTCAAPLFAMLLVEGFRHTAHFEKYLIRVGVLALVCELPYHFAMDGKLFALCSSNPVFALLICLVILFFFNRYCDKSLKNTAMKALIFAAAFLWCRMLNVEHGVCLVIFVAVLWYAREKSNARAMLAFCGAMACTLFDMYYIAAGLACIMLHRYTEERGEQNAAFNYAFYPVLLLAVGIAAKFLS